MVVLEALLDHLMVAQVELVIQLVAAVAVVRELLLRLVGLLAQVEQDHILVAAVAVVPVEMPFELAQAVAVVEDSLAQEALEVRQQVAQVPEQ